MAVGTTRKWIVVATVLLPLLLASAIPALAQGAAYVRIRHVDVDSFPEISFYAVVASENGRPLQGVAPGEVTLYENNQRMDGFAWQPVERPEPLYIVLAMDTSGSMYGDSIENARKAAHAFIDTLSAGDSVAILTFDEKINMRTGFTTDYNTLLTAITETETLDPGQGQTLLYAAAFDAVTRASEVDPDAVGRRLVLLLSDGKDTASAVTLRGVVQEAQTRGVPVFTVAIDRGRAEDKEFVEAMEEMAVGTGGIPYRITSANVARLSEEFVAVSDLLKWQYRVTYTSAVPADGASYPLKVVVDHGGSRATIEQGFDSVRRPPEVSIPNLVAGQDVRGVVTLSVQEARGAALEQVEYMLDEVSLGQVSSAPFELEWDTATASPGPHSLTARVVDTAGNIGEGSISVNVVPAVIVQILRPADGEEISDPENVGVELFVDSLASVDHVEYLVDARLVARPDQPGAPQQLNLSTFAAGGRNLLVRVYDVEGHQGEAQISLTLVQGGFNPLYIVIIVLVLLVVVVVVIVVVAQSRRRAAVAAAGAGPDTAVGMPVAPMAPGVQQVPGPTVAPVVSPASSPGPPTRVGAGVAREADTRVAGVRRREAETELMHAIEVATGWLVIKEGPGAGQQFPLRRERSTIGRSSRCDVVLGDPLVSNRHAAITREGETFTMHDLASTNGTFLRGERITVPKELQEGDEIQVGDTILVFKKI